MKSIVRHQWNSQWDQVDPDHLWIYDKLILSSKLGYVCGPDCISVPVLNEYIVRPVINIGGMGVGAKFVTIEPDVYDAIPPGYFWCEIFRGRHLSVDYADGEQVLCVEGIRDPQAPLYKWSRWFKTNDIVPFPQILQPLPYTTWNCEFIGGKLIEVHVRHNPDFTHGEWTSLIPVWKGDDTTPPPGMIFVESCDNERLGFFAK